MLLFWKEHIRALNCSRLGSNVCIENSISVFSVATDVGYGGYTKSVQNSAVFGAWSFDESLMRSTWRELEAVHRVLHSCVDCLEGESVLWNTDSKNVASVLNTGSRTGWYRHLGSFRVARIKYVKSGAVVHY